MTETLLAARLLRPSPASAPDRPPPVSVFHLADIVTGEIVAELPLGADQPLKVAMAREDSQTFSLPVFDDACPPDWQAALAPGKTMIVQTIDGFPVCGWVVIDVETGGTTVPISCSTLEECLSRTNTPDVSGEFDDATTAAMVADPLVLDFGFLIESTPTGHTTDVDYSVDEDQDVLTILTDLMATDGGPEWRIILRWSDDTHRGFDKVLQIGPRLGMVRPDAIFDLDANGKGCIDSYTRKVSYAAGQGATMVTGYSEGSGSSRIGTAPIIATDLIAAGWPVWGERITFAGLGDLADEEGALNAKTAGTARARRTGSTTWTVVGTADAPRPGVDFDPGDTITIKVAPQGRRDPSGGIAVARVRGFSLDLASMRVTPDFWENPDDA